MQWTAVGLWCWSVRTGSRGLRFASLKAVTCCSSSPVWRRVSFRTDSSIRRSGPREERFARRYHSHASVVWIKAPLYSKPHRRTNWYDVFRTKPSSFRQFDTNVLLDDVAARWWWWCHYVTMMWNCVNYINDTFYICYFGFVR